MGFRGLCLTSIKPTMRKLTSPSTRSPPTVDASLAFEASGTAATNSTIVTTPNPYAVRGVPSLRAITENLDRPRPEIVTAHDDPEASAASWVRRELGQGSSVARFKRR